MSLEWEQVIVDSITPLDLGRWWCTALGWVVVNDDPDEFEIRPDIDRVPGLLFVLAREAKTIKNRLHGSDVTYTCSRPNRLLTQFWVL